MRNRRPSKPSGRRRAKTRVPPTRNDDPNQGATFDDTPPPFASAQFEKLALDGQAPLLTKRLLAYGATRIARESAPRATDDHLLLMELIEATLRDFVNGRYEAILEDGKSLFAAAAIALDTRIANYQKDEEDDE